MRRYRFSQATIIKFQRRSRWMAVGICAFVFLMLLPTVIRNEEATRHIGFACIWSICHLIAMVVLLPFLVKGVFKEVFFTVESGMPKGFRDNGTSFLNVDLASAKEVRVGDTRSQSDLRMLIVTSKGRNVVVYHLEKMDGFISEIAGCVSTEIEFQEMNIPIYERQQRIVRMCVGFCALVLLLLRWYVR